MRHRLVKKLSKKDDVWWSLRIPAKQRRRYFHRAKDRFLQTKLFPKWARELDQMALEMALETSSSNEETDG